MYDYIAVRVDAHPCDETITDLLAAYMADDDFETFEPDDNGVTAYVRKDKFNKDSLERILEDFPIPVKFTVTETLIEGEDWNKEWEQNYFKPILLDNKVLIRSSFHPSNPEALFEIIIDPKMAFGTGHHATTAGMSRMLLDSDIKGKTVIDMGTGTGILSILSKKLGAGKTVGIDIDEFAVQNARENGKLNHTDIEWITGDERALENLESADIFLANINLNVIKENLAKYLEKLKPGGLIFLSGFLISDKPEIMSLAEKLGLKLEKETSENGWQTLVLSNLLSH